MNITDGYISYIINPKSGASSSKMLVSNFKEYLKERGISVRTTITGSMDDACELATKAAVDYDCKLIVGAGGDGTIREIAHGLEGSDKPLMIVPCGTENLLANELGFDTKVKTLINAFEGDCIKPFDLGRANGQCFTCVAGIGFDGDIVRMVSQNRKGHIGHGDYFWPIWRTFWSYKFPSVKVTVDGEEIFDGKGLVFVGNISRYAVGLEILKHADYGDGLLDVCVYVSGSRLHLAKHSALTLFKSHSQASDVVYKQGTSVQIVSTDKNVHSQIDGDPGMDLPMDIEIIPQAVRVLVPPNAKPAGIRTRLRRVIG